MGKETLQMKVLKHLVKIDASVERADITKFLIDNIKGDPVPVVSALHLAFKENGYAYTLLRWKQLPPDKDGKIHLQPEMEARINPTGEMLFNSENQSLFDKGGFWASIIANVAMAVIAGLTYLNSDEMIKENITLKNRTSTLNHLLKKCKAEKVTSLPPSTVQFNPEK